jgi:hypothetical protein
LAKLLRQALQGSPRLGRKATRKNRRAKARRCSAAKIWSEQSSAERSNRQRGSLSFASEQLTPRFFQVRGTLEHHGFPASFLNHIAKGHLSGCGLIGSSGVGEILAALFLCSIVQ